MVTIQPRSSWTSTPFAWPRYASRLFTKSRVKYLAPHYPAVPKAFGVMSAATEAGWLRTFRSWHVDGNKWADIGYGMAIGQSGRIYMCGGITHATAHAGGANSIAIGVLFLVGNTEEPSAAAIASFNALGAWLKSSQGFTAMNTVRDHGRLPGQGTQCAGQPMRRAVDDGRLNLRGRPAPAPKPTPTTPAPKVRKGTVLWVTAEAGLNGRPTASTSKAPIGTAPKGTRITATGKTSGSWVEGQTPWQAKNNVKAWWHSAHMAVLSQPAPTKPKPKPKPTPSTGLPKGGVHVVKSGDTVGAIAKRYGTTTKAIATLNSLRDPSKIEVGQRLYVAWVIGKGQTLGFVAKTMGVSVASITKANKISNPDKVEVGQLVVIP